METHLRAVGYLNLMLGALSALVCLVILVLFGGPSGVLLINARQGSSVTTTEGFITACVMIYLFLLAGPLIALGIGLLKFRQWARNLGTILSIFSLAVIPIGTAVGVYTLWVMMSFEVEPLFRHAGKQPG